MTMPKYKVVLKGNILPRADRSAVLSRLQERFHIDARKAEGLLQGNPKVIKKDLDEQAAGQYAKALKQMGLACELEPQDDRDDGGLRMERKASSSSTACCPKCSHPLGEKRLAECPACGIVLEKYHALQNIAAEDSDPPEQAAQASPAGPSQNSDAPWSVRASAAAASLVVPGAMINLISLITAVVLYFKFNDVLTLPIKADGWMIREQQMARVVVIHGIVVLIAAGIVLLYYFVVGPIRKGGTWAQRLSDLIIVSHHTGEKPGWLTWPLRTLGSIITFSGVMITIGLVCGIPQIPNFYIGRNHPLPGLLAMVLLFLAGLFLVYKLVLKMIRENRRSMADKFSGTRQLRKDQAVSIGLSALWMVIVMAALFSAGSGLMARKMMSRANPEVLRAEMAQTRNAVDLKILEKTHLFQSRYLEENGTYTDDPQYLAQEYCDQHTLRDVSYIEAAMNNRLTIVLTENGYRAELRRKDHPHQYHVCTEKGYQGLETYETD